MSHVTAYPSDTCAKHVPYYSFKTENTAVYEIWRIMYLHLLACAHTYFHNIIMRAWRSDAQHCNYL